MECTLRPDLSVLVDLALGSSKEPANSLWINMQDYAISKGPPAPPPTSCCLHPGGDGVLTACVLFQTGTTRLSATSLCWTP